MSDMNLLLLLLLLLREDKNPNRKVPHTQDGRQYAETAAHNDGHNTVTDTLSSEHNPSPLPQLTRLIPLCCEVCSLVHQHQHDRTMTILIRPHGRCPPPLHSSIHHNIITSHHCITAITVTCHLSLVTSPAISQQRLSWLPSCSTSQLTTYT